MISRNKKPLRNKQPGRTLLSEISKSIFKIKFKMYQTQIYKAEITHKVRKSNKSQCRQL